jgi:hypothetical protein
MTLPTPVQPLPPQRPGECGWSGCGHPALLEVHITIPGPPRRGALVGRYCVGHAVIRGIHEQTRHHGQLWYCPVRRQGHPATWWR